MFRFLIIFLLTFSFEVKANQIVDKLELEIKTTDDLPGEAVCRSVAPLFTSNGPWGFKLTSSVKCNAGGKELVVDPDKGPLSWELHIKFEEADLLFSICRNVRVNADQVEQNCIAKSSITLSDKRMLQDALDHKVLIYLMVARLYDQLPFKSMVTGKAKKGEKRVLKGVKSYPRKYGELTEAKISLTDDWQFFIVESAETGKPSWLISKGSKEAHQKKLEEITNSLVAKASKQWKKTIKAGDVSSKSSPPLFKISGLGSLFPKTTSKSAYTPPTIYELRFRAALERPIFGVRLLLDLGLREISSFVNTEYEVQEGADLGQIKEITAFYKDRTYYYLIGTSFRYYIYDFFIEPSIAFGASQSTLKSSYPENTIPSSLDKYRAASTRIGFSATAPLFTIPLLGDLSVAGSFYSGASKSPVYQQLYFTVSGGAVLLLAIDKAVAKARLSRVALEGYLELTKQQLRWTTSTDDGGAFENSISTAPVSGIFGASMYFL